MIQIAIILVGLGTICLAFSVWQLTKVVESLKARLDQHLKPTPPMTR